MYKLLLFFFIVLMKQNISAKQHDYENIFKNTLNNYNIFYESLEENKSGSLCIPKDIKKNYDKYAVGFSYNMYDKGIAKKIALSGCNQMKKKIILYECECEIILLN